MKKIFSIHIPKTAGSFFGQVLEGVHPDIQFFNYGINAPETRIYLKGVLKEFPVGEDLESYFFKYINDNQKGLAIMHGHVWKKHFIDEHPDAKVLTWVREPAQRLYSHYEFFKRIPHPGNKRYEKFKNSHQSFLEFATDPLNQNRQTKILDGFQTGLLSFVGVVEKINQSIDNFSSIFDFKITLDGSFNLNRNNDRSGNSYPIERSVLEEIKKSNLEDYSFYEKTLELFT